MADDDRPQYQSGVGTIGGSTFHWGSGTPGKYWSIPYGDYPVTPNAPTGAWAHQAGAIPIANNVIPDPQLGRNRIGIMIHSGSGDNLDQLYTQGCFKVAPQEWPAVRSEILKEAANGPLYLHVAPGGVAAFTNTKTFSQAGDETPAANANAAANTTAAPQTAPATGTTLNSSNVIDALSKNIAGIESAGWKNPYEALNPTTNAIGKYQVMPANVPGWTLAATGKSMTPDEFKASPEAQEAVFRDQMQRNLQLYSPKDAASIWFTGKPYNVAGGAVSDANKTTNADYVARATAGLPDSGTFTPGAAVAKAAPPATTPSTPAASTPGTSLTSVPAGALPGFGSKDASDKFLAGLKQMGVTPQGGPGDSDQQPDTPRPPPLNLQVNARNYPGIAGVEAQARQLAPQITGYQPTLYGSSLNSQPLSWGSQPIGPPAWMRNAGPQQPQGVGTSLNSLQAMDPQAYADKLAMLYGTSGGGGSFGGGYG